MNTQSLLNESDTQLVALASSGRTDALGVLFERHRDKIKRMILLRMDRRLEQRVDASDIIQETWLDCQRRWKEFVASESIPFFAWLRFLAAQRLIDVHRIHIGAKMRSLNQEVQLYSGMLPAASSLSLAEHLVGNLTSASQAAQRGEIQMRVQEALNDMEPIDREILALRHFEMLTNEETAAVLGLKKAAASNRYVRALKRLKTTLDKFSGSL